MTIAQTRAARRRIKNDPRWARRLRRDPVAMAKRQALKVANEQARKQRTKKK